ncbi:histidine kinase [Rhodoferax lacus]|uniref:Histidine kinase n=1 Tax=Rhodoferax lacus TaxID=2184758 RepID=A0A3E1RCY5_9BURK|nr:HDOD domain-containing protein [Rhodoferax lacus]RFO97225.1 histidine kinase [Rhodoferax lacus]
MDLKSLMEHHSKLPTIAQVAQRVLASFGSEDVRVGEIADLIEADPVLSAKLLRLANSSYFQLSRSVESVDDAIRVMGMAMVRQLVVTGGIVGTFANTPGMALRPFWTHSLYTACAARWLAEHSDVHGELAFTLGLLHGIGQLHMHSAAPVAMQALDLQLPVLHADRLAFEKAALGFHFLDVSAALARLWNFPSTLVEPMAQIAEPLAGPHFSEAAAVVHLAAWHARNTLLDSPPQDIGAHYPHAVAARLGISSGWVLPEPAAAGLKAMPPMPSLHELAHGLDGMLD